MEGIRATEHNRTQQENQVLRSNVAETAMVWSIARTQHNGLNKHDSVTDKDSEAHQLDPIE